MAAWTSKITNNKFLVTDSAGFIGFNRLCQPKAARVLGLASALKRYRDLELRRHPNIQPYAYNCLNIVCITFSEQKS